MTTFKQVILFFKCFILLSFSRTYNVTFSVPSGVSTGTSNGNLYYFSVFGTFNLWSDYVPYTLAIPSGQNIQFLLNSQDVGDVKRISIISQTSSDDLTIDMIRVDAQIHSFVPRTLNNTCMELIATFLPTKNVTTSTKSPNCSLTSV